MKVIVLLVLSLLSVAARAEVPQGYIAPKLVKDVKAVYPMDRFAQKAETSVDDGLVEVIYMVDETGKTFSPVVVRASMEKFIEPSLRALARYKYEPATLNNKPVQAAMRKTFEFELKAADLRSARGSTASFTGVREQGVPDGFQSFYDEFTEVLQKPAPDPARLANLLSRMVELKHQSFYGLSYHSLARYRYAEKFQSNAEKLAALSDLVWYDARVKKKYRILQDDLEDAIWSSMLQLQIESGHYADALRTHAVLSKQKPALVAPFADYISQIQALQTNDQAVQRTIDIDDTKNLTLPLLKNSFTFTDVDGELSDLTVMCQAKFAELKYQADAQYDIPKSWGACDLNISGTSGSSAKLYQL